MTHWFDKLSGPGQRRYLAKHPGSKLKTRSKGYKRHMQRKPKIVMEEPSVASKWTMGAVLKRIKG